MVIKLSKQNVFAGDAAVGQHDILHALVQQSARVVTAALPDLVNNIGAAAGPINATPTFVNVAASGSNLASKATVDAALLTVTAALAVLADKADDLCLALGLPTIVDQSGGVVAVAGTVPLVTKTVTGATTGVQANEMNLIARAIDKGLHTVARRVNEVANAVGVTTVKAEIDVGTLSNIIAVVPTNSGTAASPGVTKVALDAALLSWASGLDALADAIAAAVTPGTMRVLATA